MRTKRQEQHQRGHRSHNSTCSSPRVVLLVLSVIILTAGVINSALKAAGIPELYRQRASQVATATITAAAAAATPRNLSSLPEPDTPKDLQQKQQQQLYSRYHEVPKGKFVFQQEEYYRTAYTEATVIQQADPWFKPRKLCVEKCCAETVALSLDQDDHHIINTVDGLDVADLLIQKYDNQESSHGPLTFFASQLNDDILPCLQPGTIIHLDHHKNLLEYFFERIRPNITVPYILITSESDEDSPTYYGNRLQTDELLLMWFGINPYAPNIPENGKHKFESFPLGLSKWHDQSRYLGRYLELGNNSNPFANTERWTESFLINPTGHSSSQVDEDFYRSTYVKFNINEVNYVSEGRGPLFDRLCSGINQTKSKMDDISCRHNRSHPPHEIYAAASHYLFGFSPEGAGWDCYRTYELLLLGVIPVVPAREGGVLGLFEDLPVLELEDFRGNRTRAEYLQIFREYIQSPTFQNMDLQAGWSRLFLRHWRRRILQVAQRDGDILRDPNTGREYYQAWRYTTPTPLVFDVPPIPAETA